jgi:hypothetical protein
MGKRVLVRYVHGEAFYSDLAVSLVYGLPIEQVEQFAKHPPQPSEFAAQGRRRAREAAARTGSYEIIEHLRYFARKELGADVVWDDDELVLVDDCDVTP